MVILFASCARTPQYGRKVINGIASLEEHGH